MGLILQSLHACGASMGGDLIIRQHQEPNLDVIKTPWQHFGLLVEEIGARARYKRVCTQRTRLKKAEDQMDIHTFKTAANKLPAEDARWLGAITN